MTKPVIETVQLERCIHDEEVYPRGAVDATTVRRLAKAMAAGEEIPYPILWAGKDIIVDGVHRIEAARRVLGDGGTIEVEWREYKNKAAALLAAAEINSRHGRPMSPSDVTLCIQRLEAFAAKPEDIQRCLCLTEEGLAKIIAERTATYRGKPVALKFVMKHLAGTKLTREQAEANKHAWGHGPGHHASQLLNLLEASAIEWDNEKLVAKLCALRDALVDALKRREVG